jgi:parallel beta-helix repeat protein
MRTNLLLLLTCITIQSFATNYYVSANKGKDTNNGLSPSKPFKTLQTAANLTAPGDTVFIMNGTYTNTAGVGNILTISNSGTAAKGIVYTNYPGNAPVLKMNSITWTAISVQGAAYITINGIKVVGNNDSVTLAYAQSQENNLNNPATSGNGIGITALYNNASILSSHVTVTNCNVSQCGGGGIYTYNADYTTIENDTVSQCGWYTPYDGSGISLYQNWNSDSSTGYKNFIIGNTCYENQNFIPFYAAGEITDGNGIIIDDGRNTQNGSTLGPYIGKTYIANNVVFNNGGRGIHCYESDKVTIVNNTCYYNCQSPSVQDGDYTAYDADSISFINNIDDASKNIAPINTSSATHLTVENNLWATNSTLANPFGTNTVTGSPAFVKASTNPKTANFHLQSTSKAIKAGTDSLAPAKDKDGNPRPANGPVDIGAYQYVSTPVALADAGTHVYQNTDAFSIYPNPASNNISLQLNNAGNDALTVIFYNALGEKVKLVNTSAGGGPVTVNIAGFQAGLYYVKIFTNNKEIGTKSFIKAE